MIFMLIMTVWAGDGNGDVDEGDGDDTDENKTISDGGITVDFSIIKVHTSN